MIFLKYKKAIEKKYLNIYFFFIIFFLKKKFKAFLKEEAFPFLEKQIPVFPNPNVYFQKLFYYFNLKKTKELIEFFIKYFEKKEKKEPIFSK